MFLPASVLVDSNAGHMGLISGTEVVIIFLAVSIKKFLVVLPFSPRFIYLFLPELVQDRTIGGTHINLVQRRISWIFVFSRGQ